jgi:hypothetical protein
LFRIVRVVLALLLSVSLAHAEVVDRVVVEVEDQLVMASDIRLEQVLGGLDDSPSPFWDLERTDALSRLVEAAVFRELAGDVALYQPLDSEVIDRVVVIRSRFPSDASWGAFLSFWGLDEIALARILRRRMIVERFLARNLQVPSTERERWWTECAALLEQVTKRFRVREIPQRGSNE